MNYSQEDDDIHHQIISHTDSILKVNIKGAIDGSFVQIDRRIPLSEIDGTYKGMDFKMDLCMDHLYYQI